MFVSIAGVGVYKEGDLWFIRAGNAEALWLAYTCCLLYLGEMVEATDSFPTIQLDSRNLQAE